MLPINSSHSAYFPSITLPDQLPQEKIVASDKRAFKENMMRDIATLEINGININEKLNQLLNSDTLMNIDPAKLTSMQDIVTPGEEYIFEDLITGNKTMVDIARCIMLAEEITTQKGTKNINFECSTVSSGNLTTSLLTAENYQQGEPFLLSCKTKHCDFLGAAGGNYPLAEYLSNDGVSLKVNDKHNNYIGHFNIWKLDSGDFCIGTVAMKNNSGNSDYSPKNLKHLLLNQAVNLLENNQTAQRVLIGMGGHNMKNIFPDSFNQNGKGYEILGRLRHAENHSFLQRDVEKLEKITSMTVYNKEIKINNQENIGMQGDQRKDFKNALIILDRKNEKASDGDGIAQAKRILQNYEKNNNMSDDQKWYRELRMMETIVQKQVRAQFWATQKKSD
ncbi:SufD family Fe-S cluster assembly protein [Edwardsiella anguillarum]|uniref:hypothetical protein n=1 Tax=Edwardsiella TaxID=635 RepID=UPI00045CA59B|nr:hypothetical protein [Edwardsiella anguillarum]GAJ68794.1 hypothetical protein MA13_contig00013-0069 [Edwardsiella piscicida]WHP81848.1 hypothetical protein MQ090_08490 [Edwardsiella anguillarum]WHQ19351.1 hypothetical protein MQ085_08520 [Edwardsiella anguillarum]WHQ22895.1 hypothetical protein MQ089_08510 [Edwardsiella anguillarum]WHQ26421.1 hypothetical protein MQ094_08525 [Edwardsiella anguillarum]